MDKETFRNLVIPLSEKERLYREDPEAAAAYFTTGPRDPAKIGTDPAGSTVLYLVDRDKYSLHGEVVPNRAGGAFVGEPFFFNKQTRFSVVPPHRHEYIEMGYVYTGHCTALINGAAVEMEQGDVCIMDSGVVHTVLPTGENDILLNCCMGQNYFTASFIEHLAASGPVPRFLGNALSKSRDHDRYLLFHTASSPVFRELMENVFCEYCDPGVWGAGVISSYLNLIFIELVRCYQGCKESEYRDARKSYLTEVLRYMDDHCTTCTLEEVAGRFGYHPNYLSRMLRQATGVNFKDLVADGRLSRAALLLTGTTEPVSRIAQECGYSNQNFFYRKFAARYGCTPAAYRAASAVGRR